MTVIRCFIAIDLPPDVRESLNQVIETLSKLVPSKYVRWVPAKNIHLTLKFLGDVSQDNVDLIKSMLQQEIQNHTSFEFGVGGLGAFPRLRQPRVIWTGVEAPDELLNLQRAIEGQTLRLGYPPDKRGFSPHLTLGRIPRNTNPADVRMIGNVISKQDVGFLGAVKVFALHLIRSDLTPHGSEYTKIAEAKLIE